MVELILVTILTLIGVLVFDAVIRQLLKDCKKARAVYKYPLPIKSKQRRANL